MPRGDSLDRTLRVMQILGTARHGYTVKEVHDRIGEFHEVDGRTVRRDLQILSGLDIGVQEISARDHEGRRITRYRMGTSVPVGPAIQLDTREVLALFIARSMLKPLADTLFYQDLERFFGKIDSLINKNQLKYLEEIGQSFHFEAGPKWALGVNAEVVDTVRNACEEGHVLSFHYEGANGKPARTRRVGPHFLYFSQGALYLVADDLDDPGNATSKTFSLARMSRVERLDDAYEGRRPTPDEVFGSSFGIYRAGPAELIRIRFDAQIAPYIRERRWHASQKIVSLEDGRIELRLETGISPDLIHWLLGHGARAEVLEPGTVREQLREELARMQAIYHPPGGETPADARSRLARASRSAPRRSGTGARRKSAAG